MTGGSRGIGKAIALRFASLGATRVAIGYMRGDTPAEETASELRALGAEPILLRGNVASTRIAEDVAALGPLDALSTPRRRASSALLSRPRTSTGLDASANARALLSLTRAAAPSMPAGASISASRASAPCACSTGTRSSASKAALEALVRYLAVELARAVYG